MKLRTVRVAVFENSDLEAMMGDINDFLAGKAVTGPPIYAADEVGEKIYVDTRFASDGTNYSCILVYTE